MQDLLPAISIVQRLAARGPLYAGTFMTREEFGEMFNLDLYEKVRIRYHADNAFPHLYDKIKPEVDVFAVLAREAGEPD